MTTVAEIHAEYGIAGLKQCKINGNISLRAGVRLNICVLSTEKFLGPVNGKLLDYIDIFASAVISCTGITLGIFVGQMAAHCLHNGTACEVFGCDKLDVVTLTPEFIFHRVIKLCIKILYKFVAHVRPPHIVFPVDYTLNIAP